MDCLSMVLVAPFLAHVGVSACFFTWLLLHLGRPIACGIDANPLRDYTTGVITDAGDMPPLFVISAATLNRIHSFKII